MQMAMKLGPLGFVPAACFVLAACASGPKFSEVSSTLAKPPAGDGRIYVYRTQTMEGAAVQPTIDIGGQKAGACAPNGVSIADLPAGSYDAKAQTEAESKIHFSIEAGEEKYIRCHISMGFLVGHPNLDLIDPAQGRTDVQDLSFTGQQNLSLTGQASVAAPAPASTPAPPPATGLRAPTS
jgi:hypothetical protein